MILKRHPSQQDLGVLKVHHQTDVQETVRRRLVPIGQASTPTRTVAKKAGEQLVSVAKTPDCQHDSEAQWPTTTPAPRRSR